MKRNIAAVLSVLGVAAGVGWKVAGHPERSARLQEVSLQQQSEHSSPGSSTALARVRVRISPSDFGYEVRATPDKVPPISIAQ